MGALQLIRGVLDGLSVGTQIRNAQIQDEARRRMIAREDREMQIRDREMELQDTDWQTRMIQAGARRVGDDGTIAEELRHDGKQVAGMMGGDMIPEGTVVGQNIRKAAGGQTVRRKMKDGSTVAFELPTAEQQQERAYSNYQKRETAKQRADEQARLERETEELNRFGVDLPDEMQKVFGAKKVSPQRLAEFASAFSAIQRMRQQQNQPMIDPKNLGNMPPIPADQAGGVASLIGRLAPGSHYFNNYEDDKTTAIRENPLTGEYSTKEFAGTVAPKPKRTAAKGGSKTGAQSGGKLTTAQLADALVEKVLTEDSSGDINNAIRNVEKFYQSDPDLSRPGVRMLVKGKLEKLKRDPKFLAAQKEQQSQRKTAGGAAASGGKKLSADDYLKNLSQEEE